MRSLQHFHVLQAEHENAMYDDVIIMCSRVQKNFFFLSKRVRPNKLLGVIGVTHGS